MATQTHQFFTDRSKSPHNPSQLVSSSPSNKDPAEFAVHTQKTLLFRPTSLWQLPLFAGTQAVLPPLACIVLGPARLHGRRSDCSGTAAIDARAMRAAQLGNAVPSSASMDALAENSTAVDANERRVRCVARSSDRSHFMAAHESDTEGYTALYYFTDGYFIYMPQG